MATRAKRKMARRLNESFMVRTGKRICVGDVGTGQFKCVFILETGAYRSQTIIFDPRKLTPKTSSKLFTLHRQRDTAESMRRTNLTTRVTSREDTQH